MFGEFGPSRTNLIGRSEMTFFARFWGHLRAIKLSHVTNGTVPYSYTSTEIIYKKIIGHTGVLELLSHDR